MNLTAGTVLFNGKYVLNLQVGKGVFGITYQAINRESGQVVVIKTLGENLRQHPEIDQFKQKFLKTAKQLSRCKHQNLPNVLDYFEEAGSPYLVLEYIPGPTLATLVESNVLSEAKALKYIYQVADALSVLHKADLLHRDIKPQNIIRHQDTDCVVLCEFGITCEFTAGVIQTQANLLSAGYAPQEQYSLEAQRTRATDIYALTATLYHLLLGRPPLPAPVRESLQTNKSDRLFLPELQPLTRKLSPTVKQALWQGLAISPQKRPQTIEAWLTLFPKPEKQPLPQPKSIPDTTAAPSKNVVKVKPTLKNNLAKPNPDTGTGVLTPNQSLEATGKPTPNPTSTSQPSTLVNNSTPLPTLPQIPIAKIKTSGGRNYLVPTKRKLTKARLPLKALIMTSAIATSAGLGFGFALRINSPHEPGSSILHTEQAFPPSSKWPMSKHQL